MVKFMLCTLYTICLKQQGEREAELIILYISQPVALCEGQHLYLHSSPQEEQCRGVKTELRAAQMSRLNTAEDKIFPERLPVRLGIVSYIPRL